MFKDTNESRRQAWLASAIGAIPAGGKILDAGAGELRNKGLCSHLEYVSQDFCQYSGRQDARFASEGLQCRSWNTSQIDVVSDITSIPLPDASFDAILCSEVLEHVPDPCRALDEFSRLLSPGGTLILTAPFSSNVHQAPYHFCTGFSKFWYRHHLNARGLEVIELTPNGDWHALLRQEIRRLGGEERRRGYLGWPLGYCLSLVAEAYFVARGNARTADLACFGWHCVARKRRSDS